MLLAVVLFITFGISSPSFAYVSTYENIQWDNRGSDTYYCIDILYENEILLQAVACGENLHSWSPKVFVESLGFTEYDFNNFKCDWKVWSPTGYGMDGFEGSFVINPNYAEVACYAGAGIWDGFTCHCPFGSSWDGFACIPINPSESACMVAGGAWDGYGCVCPYGSMWDGSRCISQEELNCTDQRWGWNGETCVCTMYLGSDGYCYDSDAHYQCAQNPSTKWIFANGSFFCVPSDYYEPEPCNGSADCGGCGDNCP